MKIVHLIQYHLGGGRKRKGGKGGYTPTPQLPDAGKPYVDSISYDKNVCVRRTPGRVRSKCRWEIGRSFRSMFPSLHRCPTRVNRSWRG